MEQPFRAIRGDREVLRARQEHSPTKSGTEVWVALAVFVFALAVRLCYLAEISHNPTFLVPLVDARTHHDLAIGVVEGEGLDRVFRWWRPFFYPLALSVVYFATGSSILGAKIFQVGLGALTCLLAYRLARNLFGSATGILAGVLTALYGPLLFWEAELVAVGWGAFWSVVLIGLLVRVGAKKTAPACFVLGACGACAVITRPSFVLFIVGAFVWLVVVGVRDRQPRRQAAGGLVALLLGFALVAAPFAIQSYRVTGHPRILPSSGGLNAYVGNNPNRCETLTLRPGMEFRTLKKLAEEEGYGAISEQSRFFYGKVRDFAVGDPVAFVKGLLHKASQYANGREVPRNLDIYVFRQWSQLLRVLVWKVGGFGFPWGLLFPFALLGLVVRWREVPVPMILFVILYPLVVILVFVAGRYRAPIVPIVSILAAAGMASLFRTSRERRWGAVATGSCLVAGVALLSSLPAPSCEEKVNYEAEMYVSLASRAMEEGGAWRAKWFAENAVRLEPDSSQAHRELGRAYVALGDLDTGIEKFDEALRLREDHLTLYVRGRAFLSKGDHARAARDLGAAVVLDENFLEGYLELGRSHYLLGEYDLAREAWKQILLRAKGGAVLKEARMRLQRLRREGH